MKIHTVFITYNRLELSKRALDSYFNTVSVEHSVMICDNGSSDGTQEWISGLFRDQIIMGYVQFKTNVYPGAACNEGFAKAPDDAEFLHRADNDFVFLPGWSKHVQAMFSRNPTVGQLGLRTQVEEKARTNVGGNMVVRRQLWDDGLRYIETPWPELPTGYSEDSYLSPAVRKMGWKWRRVRKPCIAPISSEDPTDPYYQQSWKDRHIHEDLLRGYEAP